MRRQLLSIFLGLVGLFVVVTVFRVDQLLFSDKLDWSEARARAQAGALSEAFSAELKSVRETLELSLPQIKAAQKDYGHGKPYSRFAMMASVSRSGGSWNLDEKYFLEGAPEKAWGASYSTLALKSLKEKQLAPNGSAVLVVLDPSRRTHFLVLTRASTNQYMAALMGTELFQAAIDRQKGDVSAVFAVNPLGQALAHTTPEYIGSLLKDDPVVTQVVKGESASGSGVYQTSQGKVQGLFEQIPQSNVYVVIETNLNLILANRSDVRWQLILMGLGFLLVGGAVIMTYLKSRTLQFEGDASVAQIPTEPKPTPVVTGEVTDQTSARMQAYTKAASSLAHELRGPLLSLVGRARLLRESVPDENLQRELVKLEEGAREAHGTLHKLLTFAGEKEEPLVPTPLGEVLQRATRMFESTFKAKGIQFELNVQDVPMVQGQPTLLVKALEQLLNNSVEAMERGLNKKLTVELSNTDQGPRIRITDTGEGISDNHLAQIFDPFFTTKTAGQHSGLGLSLALGIIKACGGKVMVESKRGQGTQVDLIFSGETSPKVSTPKPVVTAPAQVSPQVSESVQEEIHELVATPAVTAISDDLPMPDVLNDNLMEKTLDMIDRLDDVASPFDPSSLSVPPPPPPPGTRAKKTEFSEPLPPVREEQESSSLPSNHHQDFMRFTAKIDKPKLAKKKKDSRLMDFVTEVRRPGDRT